MYFEDNVQNRTIKTGLTKEEAMAHCSDPETSSSTCTRWIGKDRTKKRGAWFDAWTDEKSHILGIK
jgi:hypothetical protein